MTLPYKGRNVQRVVIAQGAAGATDLLALVAGQRIYIVGACIGLDAAGSLKFTSGTGPTDITGAIPMGGAAAPFFFLQPDVDNPWNYTKVGEKLTLFTTTGKAFGWVELIVGLHSTPDA
jgi:hypothetical protein